MLPVPPGEQDAPLYEAFFGLREQPFALSTDPRFLFMTASHTRAQEELLTGLRRREGLMLLTGETGTGKTTLCRGVLEGLGPRTFSAMILNPYMSAAEVLRVILRDFGLVSREEIRRGVFARADKSQLLDTLESFLTTLVPLDSYAVVVIDEAQSLAPDVLDEVRMLGAFEQDGQRLLQIILVGQPLLLETLQTAPLRALNERVTRRAALVPLPLTDVEGYIRHRLTVAGGGSVSFDDRAVQIIAELSRGLPRRVNLICDRALEEGRSEGTTVIGINHVRRAAKAVAGTQQDSPATAAEGTTYVEEQADTTAATPALDPEFEPPAASRRWLRPTLAAVGAALVLAAAAGGYAAWSMVTADPGIPAVPDAPVVDRGALTKPLPPLDEERLKRLQAWLDSGG